MGQGIQQPSVEQGGAGSALADVFKVLLEPTAVFERVRARPRFLMPFLVICVIQIVLFFVNLPYITAAVQAQAATRPAGGPDPTKFIWIGAVFIPLGIGIALLIGALLMWVLVSLFGGEGKFGRLLSVSAYASMPSDIHLSIV